MEQFGVLVLPILLSAVIGYLLGSINVSIVLTKLLHKGDIRQHGSGNAGMTNVLRTVGKGPAAITFLGDFVKCVAAVLAGYFIMSAACTGAGIPLTFVKLGQYAAGIACVLGHIFPIYFRFKGGKGVVTSAAMILLLDWRVFILVLGTFLIVFAVKKIISLASLISAVLYPVYTFVILYLFDYVNGPFRTGTGVSLTYMLLLTAGAVVIGALVVVMHRANIGRLRRGEEKPITAGGKKKM